MRRPLIVLTRCAADSTDETPAAASELAIVGREIALRAALPSPATVRAAGLVEPGTAVVCVDPVTLVATLDNVVLGDVVTTLPADERGALAELVDEIADDRLGPLHIAATGQGVAEVRGGAASGGIDPQLVVGRTLRELTGHAAPPVGLRTLDSELQMALHGSALNACRAARGASPVTALWFWGAGLVAETLTVSLPWLVASDATLEAFWSASGNAARIAGHWRDVLGADEGAVIVPSDADDAMALRAALKARSAVARWRRPHRLVARDGTRLGESAWAGAVSG